MQEVHQVSRWRRSDRQPGSQAPSSVGHEGSIMTAVCMHVNLTRQRTIYEAAWSRGHPRSEYTSHHNLSAPFTLLQRAQADNKRHATCMSGRMEHQEQAEVPAALPYGGDLQAAMRAQASPAVNGRIPYNGFGGTGLLACCNGMR